MVTEQGAKSHWLFTEAHEMLRKTVRNFVEKEILPFVEGWEDKGEFPRELFSHLGELGFLGMKFPEKYGGGGEDYLGEAVFIEELHRCGSSGVAMGLVAHSNFGPHYVYKFGTEEQRQRWLVPAIKGEKIFCFAITESEAGSNMSAMGTIAKRDGNYYLVNGEKVFITNGSRADFAVIAAKTDPKAGQEGISLLVIEKGTPGFSVKRRLGTLGWRALDTAELSFENCRVPISNLLGEENKGYHYILQNSSWERICMALGAVSVAQLALEQALKYSQERVQFGQPIARFQVIQHKLSDMATQVELARALTYHALALFVRGEELTKEASMAKLLATEIAKQVTDDAVQIHGGYGYMMETPVQRLWRDARMGTIVGGSSEFMKEIILSSMGVGEKV